VPERADRSRSSEVHDDAVPTGDRVAGYLVLIYGQRLGRIVRLTTADIFPPAAGDVPDGQPGLLRLRLGSTPLQIPQPLAGHVRDLAAAHRGPSTAAVTKAWLFASRLAAGRPMTAQALGVSPIMKFPRSEEVPIT
jgi:hypothetical protein